ncbi:MAG: transketolase [Planctomycetes bacterium]|nr:transketolase [Planctomycetota bacterium]
MTVPSPELAGKIANTIRFLSADGVQAAKSGHPGMPMGCADIATVLWTRFVRLDPADPMWFNRDRVVLSAGHGSMLLYSMLHFCGFLTKADLQQFRQFASRTPGHPEYGDVPGVDVTAGPLAAGFASAVGMALAEAMLAERYNTDAHKVVDHYTYVIMGDGCQMEGLSNEAASLAGHLKLGKLIALYDDNEISIEGSTDLAFTENVNARYEALGWHVQDIDGHDHEAIAAAIQAAQAVTDKPSLIVAHTTIGRGAPTLAGSAKVHGEPLGEAELTAAKAAIGWPAESFHVPADVETLFAGRRKQWAAMRKAWDRTFGAYLAAEAERGAELARLIAGRLPDGWEQARPTFTPADTMATRASGGKVLNAFAAVVDSLAGGSADLEPSNKTLVTKGKYATWIAPGRYAGRNIHFGVREHAMGHVANGLALHGLRPYCATFMVFHDYMRPALRLAALMHLPTVFIYTHDSIFVGEDGPTHQPIEHHAAIRAIPRIELLRPCDANEVAYAWQHALARADGPTCLSLTRQNLPTLDRTKYGAAEGVLKGGYILDDEAGADLVLIASGSEVHLAIDAAALLRKKGRKLRIVSMPGLKLFAAQPKAYRDTVLPPALTRRVVLEAGIVQGWEGLLGGEGLFIGLDDFGASGPMAVLAEQFGLTAPKVVQRIEKAGL